MLVQSISPLVDSCSSLIHKKALRTFKYISPENKRWIDAEDVIQDGFITAWEAEQHYCNDRGAKYSSYLFRGLDMAFSAKYVVPLRQKKRVGKLLELDAPVGDSDENLTPDLRARELSPEEIFQAVSGILQVCRSVPPRAVSFLLDLLISEHTRVCTRTAKSISFITAACHSYGVQRWDLESVVGNKEAKGMVLQGVLRSGTKLGEDDAKVLECIECRAKFSLADARAGYYSATSLTCKSCLKKLYADSTKNSCFGRRKVLDKTRVVVEGYSEADTECRLHCRDRVACVRFIEERGTAMTEDVDNIDVDLEDVDFSDIETEDATDEADVAGDEAEDEAGADMEDTPAPSKKVHKQAKVSVTKPVKVVKTAVKKDAAKKVKSVSAEASKKASKASKSSVEDVASMKLVKKDAAKKGVKDLPTKTAVSVQVARAAKVRGEKSTERIDPKAAKAQGLIQLDEQGRDLPFKAGAMMRWILEQCLEPGGATEKSLEKEVVRLGYDWKFQRTILMSGKSGDSSLRPYPSTHTWAVEAEGGRVQVSNVKRIAYYAKLPRISGFKSKK